MQCACMMPPMTCRPQLTSLTSFVPRFARVSRLAPQHLAHRRRSHVLNVTNTLELLRGAEQLHVPHDAGPAEGQEEQGPLPPYQEWSEHPELLQGCEPGAAPLRVAVLLSGGVDSSLALHLLRAAGHSVTAFYLQIWFQEDFRNFWDSCPWEEDLDICQKVCEQLGVELVVVPLTQQYWDRVVAHSIGEIRQGRTPNPDVLCNSRVKFGAFYEYLEQTYGSHFDRVASGHYARLERPQPAPLLPAAAGSSSGGSSSSSSSASSSSGDGMGARSEGESGVAGVGVGAAAVAAAAAAQPVRLALTPDAVKDQTYFLAHLSQAQLARTMFPLGHFTKGQVRQLAAAAALPNQSRKDSQGICFLGKVKFSEFVKEHLGEWPGPFVEEETGEVVGYHKGFWFHTVGQRKGVQLSGGPWYVTRKDPGTNVVYVSRQYYDADKVRNAFSCTSFNWIGGGPPAEGTALQCKVRHGPNLYPCELQLEEGGARGQVQLAGNDQGLAAGQFAVFYQDGCCLGSAIISG